MKKNTHFFLSMLVTIPLFMGCKYNLPAPIIDAYFDKTIVLENGLYTIELIDGVELDDGSFILAGNSKNHGNGDVVLIKLALDGSYKHFYFGDKTINEEISGFCTDKLKENFYLCGKQTIGTSPKGLLMKIDKNMIQGTFGNKGYETAFVNGDIAYRKILKSEAEPNSLFVIEGYRRGVVDASLPPQKTGIRKFDLTGNTQTCSLNTLFQSYQVPLSATSLASGNMIFAGTNNSAYFYSFSPTCNKLVNNNTFTSADTVFNYIVDMALNNDNTIFIAVNSLINGYIFKTKFYSIDVNNNYTVSLRSNPFIPNKPNMTNYHVQSIAPATTNNELIFATYWQTTTNQYGIDIFILNQSSNINLLKTYENKSVTKIIPSKSGGYLFIGNRTVRGESTVLKVNREAKLL